MGKKRIGWAVGIVLLLVAMVVASVVGSGEEKGVEVYQHEVAPSDLSAEVSASGEVEARRAVRLSSEVSGKVKEIRVEAGQAVKTGDVLVRIDEESVVAEVERLEAEVAMQRISIEGAGLSLDQATADLARIEALHQRQVISQGDLETSRLKRRAADIEVQQARERLRQSEAQLRQSRENLARTTITSPLDGVVTVVYLKEGEGVIPGFTNTAGTVILEIADLTEMWVRVDVGEEEIPAVKVGQKARVTVDALPARVFDADVREMALQGERSGSDVTRFSVRLKLNEPDAALRPGMSTTANIVTDTRQQILTVPIQAVQKKKVEKDKGAAVAAKGDPKASSEGGAGGKGLKDEKPEDQVWVVNGGKVSPQTVLLGISSDTQVEILQGIKAGDLVVTGPYRLLKDLKEGDPVRRKEDSEEKDPGKDGDYKKGDSGS